MVSDRFRQDFEHAQRGFASGDLAEIAERMVDRRIERAQERARRAHAGRFERAVPPPKETR